jgi:hypothetical protein
LGTPHRIAIDSDVSSAVLVSWEAYKQSLSPAQIDPKQVKFLLSLSGKDHIWVGFTPSTRVDIPTKIVDTLFIVNKGTMKIERVTHPKSLEGVTYTKKSGK